MTTTDFVKTLRDAHAEEVKDSEKYMNLAKNAPTAEIRNKLIHIAKDEIMHRAKLEGMILMLEGSL